MYTVYGTGADLPFFLRFGYGPYIGTDTSAALVRRNPTAYALVLFICGASHR